MTMSTILDGVVKGWCCLQIWMVPVMVPSIILDGSVYKVGWCNQMMMVSMDGAVYKFGWCNQMMMVPNVGGAVNNFGWCCLQIWMVQSNDDAADGWCRR